MNVVLKSFTCHVVFNPKIKPALLSRILVNSIALVKPEKARQVEGMLIQMASSGQLGGKVGKCY